MNSALPGLNEPFAKQLADRKISFGRLPAVFRPELFKKPTSPFSLVPQECSASESYSRRRLLSEILSTADDPRVIDEESYFSVSVDLVCRPLEAVTLADIHRLLLSIKGHEQETEAGKESAESFALRLVKKVLAVERRTGKINPQKLTSAYNLQRAIAHAPFVTKKEVSEALDLLPSFQASFIEHYLDEIPSNCTRAFYRALLKECKSNLAKGPLTEILLTRYERFFNVRIRRAIRQFRSLLIHIVRAARLNNVDQVRQSYVLAEKLLDKLSSFGAFSLDDRFSLNPIDECYLIWQAEKAKIPTLFREGYEAGIVRALSSSSLLEPSLSKFSFDADSDFAPICLQLKDGSELVLTQTSLIVNEELFSFSGIDTLFYCNSPVRATPNDPNTFIHCFGFRTFDLQEKRFRFDEESEWSDFSSVFNDYAFPLISEKNTEHLRVGGRFSFNNVRITDNGIELPQKGRFWGDLSFVFYPWKDVFIEFSDKFVILHAGSEKAYIDTWKESYITNLYPLLKQQSIKTFDRLSEQKPIFELQARSAW